MRRSVFLMLISVLVLSAAVALPASLKESLQENSNQDSEVEIKAISFENVESIEAAKGSASSSEEHKDKAKDASASSEEEPDKTAVIDGEHSMEAPARRRRSAEYEKNRNLFTLATICPEKDFSSLEEGPLLSRIEIPDMYAVCAQLKDRPTRKGR